MIVSRVDPPEIVPVFFESIQPSRVQEILETFIGPARFNVSFQLPLPSEWMPLVEEPYPYVPPHRRNEGALQVYALERFVPPDRSWEGVFPATVRGKRPIPVEGGWFYTLTPDIFPLPSGEEISWMASYPNWIDKKPRATWSDEYLWWHIVPQVDVVDDVPGSGAEFRVIMTRKTRGWRLQ